MDDPQKRHLRAAVAAAVALHHDKLPITIARPVAPPSVAELLRDWGSRDAWGRDGLSHQCLAVETASTSPEAPVAPDQPHLDSDTGPQNVTIAPPTGTMNMSGLPPGVINNLAQAFDQEYHARSQGYGFTSSGRNMLLTVLTPTAAASASPIAAPDASRPT